MYDVKNPCTYLLNKKWLYVLLGKHRSSYPPILELIMVQRLETFCSDTQLSGVYSLNFNGEKSF